MSAGGGAGEVALHNAKLDALWTLKQFSGVPLKVAGFDSQAEAAAEGMKIQEAVKMLHGLETLHGQGFVFDGLRHQSYLVTYSRMEDCPSHDRLESIETPRLACREP